MLVLTRKTSEVIHIGDNITITVLGIDRGQVKLGLDAPKDIVITRGELLLREGYSPRAPVPKGVLEKTMDTIRSEVTLLSEKDGNK